jgi:hypothetical protein
MKEKYNYAREAEKYADTQKTQLIQAIFWIIVGMSIWVSFTHSGTYEEDTYSYPH